MKKLITLFFISLFFVGLRVNAQAISCVTAQEKAKCQTEYDQLQTEIAQWQKVLDDTKAKKSSLQGDVTTLNAQIAKAQVEIKQRAITVSTLTDQINQKQANISSLTARIENDKSLLANLLKKKDQNEVQPIFYLLLSAPDLSKAITDADNIEVIDQGLQALFAELDTTKTQTQKAKAELDTKKNQELDAKYEVEQKKKMITKMFIKKIRAELMVEAMMMVQRGT